MSYRIDKDLINSTVARIKELKRETRDHESILRGHLHPEYMCLRSDALEHLKASHRRGICGRKLMDMAVRAVMQGHDPQIVSDVLSGLYED